MLGTAGTAATFSLAGRAVMAVLLLSHGRALCPMAHLSAFDGKSQKLRALLIPLIHRH
jgi:hypothetical protein